MQLSVRPAFDTGGRSILLPQNFIRPMGLYDSDDDRWWWRYNPTQGDIMFNDGDTSEFWLWGDRIYLMDKRSYSDDDLTLYYYGYYPDITIQEDGDGYTFPEEDVLTPDWAEVALLHLGTAFCWQPAAIEAAELNEYKLAVEAGTPVHNPRSLQAREHLYWYDQIVNRVETTV